MACSFGWRASLELPFWRAPRFYLLLGGAVGAAVLLQGVNADPMRMLFWAAVINGVVAVPLMAVIVLLACRRDVMGPFTLSATLRAMGWLSTAVMAVAVGIMFWTW